MVNRGFTLVELIVAIVVIGIALMSVPLMLSQATRSNEFSINQEIIFAATTKLGDILTYPWDDKLVNTLDNKHILDVTNADKELNRYPDINSSRRIGNFKADFRRKFNANQIFASSIIGRYADKNVTSFDDIDDFNGTSQQIISNTNGDYLIDLNICTIVKYIPDIATYSSSPTLNLTINTTSTKASTNIKLIEVNVFDSKNHKKITTLSAFSANIGTYELLYRTFP